MTEGTSGCSQDCGPGDAHAPICTENAPKAAIGTGTTNNGKGSVKAHWIPSTDPHDFQILKFGYSTSDMPYGIDRLDANANEVDLNGLTSGKNAWFIVGTDFHHCVSWSTPSDDVIE